MAEIFARISVSIAASGSAVLKSGTAIGPP